MSELKVFVQLKKDGQEANIGISTPLPEVNSPEDLRKCLHACADGIVYALVKKTPLLQEPANEALPLKEYLNLKTPPNPPRKIQLRKILEICENNGLSIDEVAKKYGVSSIQDMTRKGCNEFINQYKS